MPHAPGAARRIPRIPADADSTPDPQDDLDALEVEAPPFAVERRDEGAATVVSVTGEIDIATAPRVAEAVRGAHGLLVLDLAGVGFMDTSGIRLIVELLRGEQDGGPELVLAAPGPDVRRLLDMSGLSSRLRFAATVDEALG